MTNLNNQETVAETYHQAQDSPMREESPQSIQFILPTMVGAPKSIKETMWRDILRILGGIGMDVELLLIRSAPIGKGKAKYITQNVVLVVNKAGLDAPTLERTSQVIDSLFPNQTTTRAGSQAPWICVPSTANAADVIGNNIENLREARRANLTNFSRAIWCRVDKTGIMKRASIDLSKEPGTIRFRTVTEKKEYGKKSDRRRTTGKTRKKIEMSNKPKQEKWTEDKEAVGAEGPRQSRIASYRGISEILREISAAPVPTTMEEILRYSITGFRSFHDEVKAQTAEGEATSPSRGEESDG